MGLRPGGKVGVPFEARPIPASEKIRFAKQPFSARSYKKQARQGCLGRRAKLPDFLGKTEEPGSENVNLVYSIGAFRLANQLSPLALWDK